MQCTSSNCSPAACSTGYSSPFPPHPSIAIDFYSCTVQSQVRMYCESQAKYPGKSWMELFPDDCFPNDTPEDKIKSVFIVTYFYPSPSFLPSFSLIFLLPAFLILPLPSPSNLFLFPHLPTSFSFSCSPILASLPPFLPLSTPHPPSSTIHGIFLNIHVHGTWSFYSQEC